MQHELRPTQETVPCAACRRPLPYRQAALIGHWAGARETMRFAMRAQAALTLRPAYVCRGMCRDEAARQRLAEQFEVVAR